MRNKQPRSFFTLVHRLLIICAGFLFLFGINGGNVMAQRDIASAKPASLHASPYSWQIYSKPLSLIDPVTGTLQLGAEKILATHFSVAADYGLQCNVASLFFKDSDRHGYRYGKLSGELRYLLNRYQIARGGVNAYFALRGCWFPQHYRKDNDYVTLHTISYSYDYSNITRHVYTADVLAGFRLFGKHLVYNSYFGIGVRSLSIHHDPHILTPGYPSYAVEDFTSHIDRQEGTFYRPDFCLGLTIGYGLGKGK